MPRPRHAGARAALGRATEPTHTIEEKDEIEDAELGNPPRSVPSPRSCAARLPFGSEATSLRVRRRLRAQTRASMWGVLGLLVVAWILLVATPVGSSPQFLLVLTVTLLACVLSASAVVVDLREQLFRPDRAHVRVAHGSG